MMAAGKMCFYEDIHILLLYLQNIDIRARLLP